MSVRNQGRIFSTFGIGALLLALAGAGCGDDPAEPVHNPDGDDDALGGDAAVTADASGADAAAGCTIETADPPNEGANHTPGLCLPVQYGSNPPSSGTHYSEWPVFRAYDKPVPWGFLVHGLEHGAVVLAYNCPEGCPADVAAAKAVMQTIPPRSCGRPPVILTPDPTLTIRFAAAAWGHILRATCFEPAAFTAFITAHMNQGPENIAGDCGVYDQEAPGWCP